MNDRKTKTVLLTGANSGVGYEAAAQLAEAGYGEIILACRTDEKGERARASLTARTGRDAFSTLALDTSEVASAEAAVEELSRRGARVDVLILNAGASGSTPTFNSDGVETTWSSTLVGHHVLTMRMLEHGLLSPHARILIAGSEGARGNLPGMKVHEIGELARERFDGDEVAAIVALARVQAQDSFVNMKEYVTAKRVVAWWAAALSRKLPAGMTVNAVSPGSAPASNFGRDASMGMRVMAGFMKLFGPFVGMGGGLDIAARRYLEAAELGDDVTGRFYATKARKKLVGPMDVQTWPPALTNEASQEAGFRAIEQLTGTPFPAARPST